MTKNKIVILTLSLPKGKDLLLDRASHEQVPRGFSLGSHSSAKILGFSPAGMPFCEVASCRCCR